MEEQQKPAVEAAEASDNASIPEDSAEKKGGNKWLLPVSILIAALIIGGAIFYSAGKVKAPTNAGQATTTVADIVKLTPRDVVLGNQNAPVTLIEYGDYQCPFCNRFFTDTEAGLKQDYIPQGKVKMVFRNFAFLGPESLAAAQAAECANDQGKYWDYHDALYQAETADEAKHPGVSENNGNLNRALFMKIASDLKLNTTNFGTCIDSNKYAGLIQTDTQTAQGFGITGTPTFFINDQEFPGLIPYTQVKQVIDGILKQG